MIKPNLPIKQASIDKIINDLSLLQADEIALYMQTRAAHWNVIDPDFKALHNFFKEQYEEIDDFFDDVAERIVMLGGTALHTLKQIQESTNIEGTLAYKDAQNYISDLLSSHEYIINYVTDIIDYCSKERDHATVNMLSNLIEKHSKIAWQLRASLKQ